MNHETIPIFICEMHSFPFRIETKKVVLVRRSWQRKNNRKQWIIISAIWMTKTRNIKCVCSNDDMENFIKTHFQTMLAKKTRAFYRSPLHFGLTFLQLILNGIFIPCFARCRVCACAWKSALVFAHKKEGKFSQCAGIKKTLKGNMTQRRTQRTERSIVCTRNLMLMRVKQANTRLGSLSPFLSWSVSLFCLMPFEHIFLASIFNLCKCTSHVPFPFRNLFATANACSFCVSAFYLLCLAGWLAGWCVG